MSISKPFRMAIVVETGHELAAQAQSFSNSIREHLITLGIDAREPSEEQPGPAGDFVTVGVVEGVDGPLVEIDTPEQCQSWPLDQAAGLVTDLYELAPGGDKEALRHQVSELLRGGT